MNKNSIGIKLRKKLGNNKLLKSILYKSVFAMAVLLVIFLFTKINTNPTNRLLRTIKTGINYDYQVKDDSIRIYTRAKDMLNSTIESIPVFNTGEKLEPPVLGTVYRSFDARIQTSDGIKENGGIEIKLLNEEDPISISHGRVTKVEKRDNLGYFVSVEDGDFKIIYGYLENTPLKEGDIVNKGDRIGQVGINKDGTRYLRLELYINGQLENPEKYINF